MSSEAEPMVAQLRGSRGPHNPNTDGNKSTSTNEQDGRVDEELFVEGRERESPAY